jgi:hypothetical protein
MPAAVAVAAVDAAVAVLAEKGQPLGEAAVVAVVEGGCGCQEDSTRPA